MEENKTELDSGDEARGSSAEKLTEEMKNVLKNSMLTGVPHVIEEKRIVRRIIKIAILGACLAGFTFHISQFLTHFYSNPTIVEHSMKKVERFVYPSIVMCNKNPIYRSKYCDKFPENCTRYMSKRVCFNYPHYCSEGDEEFLSIPDRPTDWMTMNATDLKALSYNYSKFISGTSRKSEVSPEPYYYKTFIGQIYFCYKKYYRGDNNQDLYYNETGGSHYVIWNSYFFDDFDFNLEAHETFHYAIVPGALFDIQSPFETQFKGISLEQGKGYHIYIDLEEEHLLPPPYATNCRNYTDEWLKNDRTGPRSQRICQEECHKTLSQKVCGCLHEYFFFGNLYQMDLNLICSGEQEKNCTDKITTGKRATLLGYVRELSACKNMCRDDCLIRRFHYQVQEYDNGLIGISKYRTSVYLSLKNLEVKVISHKPKFESVEIYSNIGGYLGLWLGFCVVAGIDFLQSLLLVLLFAMHKCCYKCMTKKRMSRLNVSLKGREMSWRSFWRKQM